MSLKSEIRIFVLYIWLSLLVHVVMLYIAKQSQVKQRVACVYPHHDQIQLVQL